MLSTCEFQRCNSCYNSCCDFPCSSESYVTTADTTGCAVAYWKSKLWCCFDVYTDHCPEYEYSGKVGIVVNGKDTMHLNKRVGEDEFTRRDKVLN